MKTRYQASLIGCIAGDTLGMPVETWSKGRILKHVGRITSPIEPTRPMDTQGNALNEDEFGKIMFYPGGLKKGDYTDDTILTFAFARALIEKGMDLEHVAQRQLNEYVIRIRPDGSYAGGFGRTTVDGLKNILVGKSALESGIIEGSGNAPPMKMAPLGIYMHATGKVEEGLIFAEKVGRITHLDPRSVVGGVVHAQAIYSLLNRARRGDFINEFVETCKKWEKPLTKEFVWHKSGNLLSRLEWIRDNRDVSADKAFEYLGASSAVYRSYPFTLFMFQKYWNNPLKGLIETVNYGEDCDTTGAMYGTLAGAKNGMIFPDNWLKDMQGVDEALDLGGKLFNLRGK